MAFFKNLAAGVQGHVTECLGEDAIFRPCKGDEIPVVRVVFDNTFQSIDPDTETVVSSNQPRIFVRLSDFPNGINEGDKFVLEGSEFRVWTVQEDGQGGADILLHKMGL